MTPEEIIMQVKTCKNLKVLNNPFIKIFLRLDKEELGSIATVLSNNHLSILAEDESIITIDFLPYLWTVLTIEQKKVLIPDVLHLLKEGGAKILTLLPHTDVDLIFETFDITKLAWEWKDIRHLFNLFSDKESQKHIKCYFNPYIAPFFCRKQFSSEEKLKALLDPLTEEECYWIFMNLDIHHFMICFTNIDFLFRYLSSKNRVSILKRVSSDAIVSFKKEIFVCDKFKIFLKKFDIEDRTEVIQLINIEDLREIITLIIELKKILKILPESERYDLVKLLGVEQIKKIISKNKNNSSYYLFNITEKLLPEHRLEFLMGFDKDYIQQIFSSWEIILELFNILPKPDNTIFLKYIRSHIVSSPDITELEEISPENRLLFIAQMNAEELKDFFNNSRITYVLEKLPDKDRFDCIFLANEKLPGGLEEIFKSDSSWGSYYFKEVALLLPENHQVPFFDLFSKDYLQFAYRTHVRNFENIGKKLKNYLKGIEKTIIKNELSKSSFDLHTSKIAKNFHEDRPLVPDFFSPTLKKITGQDDIRFGDTEKLDNLIVRLAAPQYNKPAYKNLQNALLDLRRAVSLPFLKEFKDPYGRKKEGNRQVINFTIDFLEEFLLESNANERLRMIEAYEDKIQPFKTLNTIGKCLGGLIIAALCIVSAVSFGVGIGLLAGSWTGPGAIVTGFAGLFAGLAIASSTCYAGVAFFKSSPIKRATENIIRSSKNIVEEVLGVNPPNF